MKINKNKVCEHAVKNEWGPVINCLHQNSDEVNFGYCDKNSCPKKVQK